jgi:hypothetical protein
MMRTWLKARVPLVAMPAAFEIPESFGDDRTLLSDHYSSYAHCRQHACVHPGIEVGCGNDPTRRRQVASLTVISAPLPRQNFGFVHRIFRASRH